MSNLWNSLGLNNNTNAMNGQGTNFNIQEFMKFTQQMRGKDPNQVLQNMLSNGQITQQQLENAKSQANGILSMLQSIGFVK